VAEHDTSKHNVSLMGCSVTTVLSGAVRVPQMGECMSCSGMIRVSGCVPGPGLSAQTVEHFRDLVVGAAAVESDPQQLVLAAREAEAILALACTLRSVL